MEPCKAQFISGVHGEWVAGPGWKERKSADDEPSALVYSMSFRKDRGVGVKRSKGLRVREALALIHAHLCPAN